MKKTKLFWMLLILVMAFIGCSKEKNRDEETVPIVKVAIIGDSISDGCNPDLSTSSEGYAVRYGYAQMLEGLTHDGIESQGKTIYNIWQNANFKNFSITGSRASEWNSDSSDSTKWHTWDNEFQKVLDFNPDVAVVYLGANDILNYLYDDGVVTTTEWSKLASDLKGVIDQLKAKNSNIKIVIMGYYDLFDGYSSVLEYSPIEAFKAYKDMSSITVAGNKIISDLAAAEGAVYVDNYTSFMNHCYGVFIGNKNGKTPLYISSSLTTFDIHPVTAGHKVLFENIYSALESIK